MQYEALRPFLTERIIKLAGDRLFNGLKFFDKNTLRKEYRRGEVKTALLLVKCVNPEEYITGPENEILTGGQRSNRVTPDSRKGDK